MDFLHEVRSKIAALRKELAEWELVERKASELGNSKILAATGAQIQVGGAAPAILIRESKMQRILRLSESSIREKGALQTPALVDLLMEEGVQFGEDAKGELSSYLSRSKRFENRRKDGGWFLIEGAKK
jgi:hypothetical protein